MISPEFKAAVSEGNLLRVRIMLKDSFVIDSTFMQFHEMLSYAAHHLPNLMVPYDGGSLEDDPLKWNLDTMNGELVQLVTNFSEVRINHLKKVVSKVLNPEAEKARAKQMEENRRKFHSAQSTQNSAARRPWKASSVKDLARHDALKALMSEARKINKIMFEVESNRSWKPYNIDEMEQAARALLDAIQKYKDNR